MWGWFAITTQFGRRESINRVFENGAAPLQTLDNNFNVMKAPSQSVFGISEIPSAEHPNNDSSNGDKHHLGPFYNYARRRTWSNFASNILMAFRDVQTNRDQGAKQSEVRNSALTMLRHRDLFAWMDTGDSQCFSRAMNAFLCAFILQAFTGWSAFMIAYKTPTVGMGCRGFAFLMYNILSLLACVLLISASYFSDR